MLRFEGNREFAQRAEELFAKLTDARFLVTCVPDVETISEVQADHASVVVRPGLSFVRGTLQLDARVTEASAPTSARIEVKTKGIGSNSTVEAQLTFTPQETGTRIHWLAEVKELGGLLKMVPSGLIRGAADKVINDVWTRIESQAGM